MVAGHRCNAKCLLLRKQSRLYKHAFPSKHLVRTYVPWVSPPHRCDSAYISRVPRLREMLLSQRHGFMGAFYKFSVIGKRLHWAVSLGCLSMSLYLLFMK
eukprot:GGOE01018283.1.p4 GENE.GGOE01018283.1~~GGOE01018283.1.p4  ORF type:complete len:100 (-),score=20.66 GGOE01018283.1:161-460(-)